MRTASKSNLPRGDLTSFVVGGATAALALGLAARRLRRAPWRATPAERRHRLPGDDVIAGPIASLTHAITVRCPPADVWPWLVQMGAGRAGWYSYDRIDNGGRPSLRRIAPELQDIAVGSILPAAPGVTDGFTVLEIEPARALVLGWTSPDGRPVTTWAFVLEPAGPGHTRLLVRARATPGYRAPFGLPDWTVRRLVPFGHAVMQRRQLLGIRARAEHRSRRGGRGLRIDAIPPRSDERPIDRFLPDADHGGAHEIVIDAPADIVFDTACTLRLESVPLVRAIFRMRERLMRSAPAQPIPPTGIVEMTTRLGWGTLAHRPGRELVMGAVTRPWEADVTFTAIPPDRFADFAEPGLVRIAWTLEAEPLGPTRTRFRTETRARATDTAARRRFARYWRWAGFGIIGIRLLVLPRLRHEAERRYRREWARA